MYNPFGISAIDANFSDNTVVILCNNLVDPNTVNDENIFIYNHEGAKFTKVNFSTDDTKIIVKIDEQIVPNTEYIISISNLKTVMGEKLLNGIMRSIIFESSIKDVPVILSPSQFESVTDVNVQLQGTLSEGQVYRIQLSTNTAFGNLVIDTTSNKNSIMLNDSMSIPKDETSVNFSDKLIADGQYYIRARIENVDRTGIYYGQWSEVIAFMKISTSYDEYEDEDEDFPSYLPTLTVIGTPVNNVTTDKIIITFSEDIDPESISNVVVVRSDI